MYSAIMPNTSIYSRILKTIFRIRVDIEILIIFYEQPLCHSTITHEQP